MKIQKGNAQLILILVVIFLLISGFLFLHFSWSNLNEQQNTYVPPNQIPILEEKPKPIHCGDNTYNVATIENSSVESYCDIHVRFGTGESAYALTYPTDWAVQPIGAYQQNLKINTPTNNEIRVYFGGEFGDPLTPSLEEIHWQQYWGENVQPNIRATKEFVDQKTATIEGNMFSIIITKTGPLYATYRQFEDSNVVLYFEIDGDNPSELEALIKTLDIIKLIP